MPNKYIIYRHALIWDGALEDEKKLAPDKAYTILKNTSAWMLRNIYDFDIKEETNFWYIIKDSYLYDEYSKKTKKYIRKANEKFLIGVVSKSVILQQGYDVYKAAHKGYKINDGFILSKKDYIDFVNSLNESYEFWGCVDRDTNLLQAYSICKVHDGFCWFEYSRANPEFLPKYYPMYGLYDARNRYYLLEKKFNYVLTSARSISQHSSIQDFLIEKFNFRKAYCHFSLYYKTWLRYIIKILYPVRSLIPYKPIKNLLFFEELNRKSI